MKMRMKENVELGIRESYLGVHGSMTLKAGDVFEVTKMCGGCKLERDGMRIYAAGGFDQIFLEEIETELPESDEEACCRKEQEKC